MSIQAYRIIKIERDKPSFNCSHEPDLMRFLEGHKDTWDSRLCNGGGIIEVSIDALREAVDKADELGISKETVDALLEDVSKTIENDEDIVLYECF